MSQEEVLRALEEDKMATVEEIASKIHISPRAVSRCLKKMLRDSVERIPIYIKYSRISYAWKIMGSKVPKNKLKEYIPINEKGKTN